MAALFLARERGCVAGNGDVSTAYTNARHLRERQRSWGLPGEARLHRAVLGSAEIGAALLAAFRAGDPLPAPYCPIWIRQWWRCHAWAGGTAGPC